MPGHFTHIYTARRVADWLGEQTVFNPDDVSSAGNGQHLPELLGGFGIDPQRAAQLMHTWPKFANVGAVGPDLFFFCEDYSSGPLAAFKYQDDLLMLAMAIYFWVDAAKEQGWEPLLVLLAEVDQTFARIVRFLIKLQKLWAQFIAVWQATIGPIVSTVGALLDDLTGGLLSEVKVAFDELLTGLLKICEEELVTFADIFSWFSLKMRVGWDEQAFVWSDMLHYRRTNQMARNLMLEAQRQFAADGDAQKLEQFQAYVLGWICHIGTDVIAHSFVNEQAGGPFRTHWQRHHVVENHIDAWNYRQAGAGGSLPFDNMASNDTYPDMGQSALWYAVALDAKHPNGWERPATLPADAAAAKKALDIDGEMPDWLADGIVRALIATYHDGSAPEPKNLGGKPFQDGIGTFNTVLQTMLDAAGINIDRPLNEVVAQVAPTPSFDVPEGYPLPWEVKTAYKFMLLFYKLSFWGGFDLAKPREPQVIIWPPASDFSDLASAPDLSGPSSGDPATDFCDAIKSILDWFKKEVEALGKLIGDIIKALASPGSYPLRWALYQAAMYGWDLISTAHEILAHTGFVQPHGERHYPDNGELMLANEIDHALIQLGNTVDAAFAQALADATDPLANLDKDPSLLGSPHNPRERHYPYLPVRPQQASSDKPNEFRRPWAYPDRSRRPDGSLYPTPEELSDITAELDDSNPPADLRSLIEQRLGNAAGTVSGPYPQGATPDAVLFRTNRPVDIGERAEYEAATSPAHTDYLNETFIGRSAETDHSPLGDPIPFSAYLIGQILSAPGYLVDFNLDADRGYGYRCWDWIRGAEQDTNDRGQPYLKPVVAPEGSKFWAGAAPDGVEQPVRLRYVPSAPAKGGPGGLR